ncbi:MAG: hypothetical protein M9958_09785 [Chitinophagales bacterium]|nr:hypothetical protein [Chitinophagales bacterium]
MYQEIVTQLDQFIRKYYLSKVIKGILLFTASIISIYILFSIGEFAFYFPTWMRWILLLGFSVTSIFALISWIGIPIAQYFKLGKTLSYQQAAEIIGKYFPEIDDKLLNILQLNSQQATTGSQELLQASIQQKIQQIHYLPFSNAVDLKDNKKFFRYTLPPLIALLAILLIAPNILKESNARLIQPSKTFEKPAPFEYFIEENFLKVNQFEDAEIIIKVKGKILPEKIEWVQNGQTFHLLKKDANTFTYKVQNVEQNTDFKLLANGFLSKTYTIQVVKRPVVATMNIQLTYPSYTKRKNESIKNTGDLVVPIGTKINWNLSTTNTNQLAIQFLDEEKQFLKSQDGKNYTFQKTALKDFSYKIYAYNNDKPKGDSVLYNISIIEDQFPAIQVQQVNDSTQKDILFFLGNASDDYGISKVSFHLNIKNDKGQIRKNITSNIAIKTSDLVDFTHYIQLNSLKLQAGEMIEYYFITWDNDAINGNKSTKSPTYTYSTPSIPELKDQENANNENIKSSLQSSTKEIQKLSKELQSLKENILTKKSLNWEDKKEINNLLDKHEQIKRDIQDIQEKFKENIKNQDLFKEVDPEIMKKQELIQQMMEDLLSQEMKDLIKEIEDLLEKFQKENAFNKLENVQMNNEKLNKELDKMLELFKKLELEQKATDLAQQLENLSEKQKDAQQKPDADKQNQLNQEFQEIKKDFEQLQQLNQQQDNHLNLDSPSKEKEEIEENMNKAKENLEKNQNQPAKSQQQKASDGMKQMAENIRSQMSQMQMQQQAEDINTIRRILSNLIKFSKNQEDLMQRVKKSSEYDTKYSRLIQEQQRLKEESVIIEDSLTALGKRVFQLQNFITDELYQLKRELKKSTDLLDKKQKGPATAAQQFSMTHANNLALMLSEVMNQMQQQMNKMSGSGSCKNPGGNQPKMPGAGEMQKLQEQMGQDLKKMSQQLKEGQSGSKINKELAEMAQRQAAIREALSQMKEGMSQQQKKEGNIDKLLEDLEKNEADIVNKRINQETLLRQKNIETRMLEMEKSMREQDEKEDRSSQSAQDFPATTPPQLEEFLKKRKSNLNLSDNLPPELKLFYKRLVDRYNANQ